jgi:DNA-binding SARP family transcriptional activator
MSLTIQLLGRPRIDRTDGDHYQVRSRKSWAALAYLLLSERPPTRNRLAALLFAEADDPLRALRWSLSEIRRCLGDEGTLDGDPLVLRLPADAVVDVEVVAHGSWAAAADLPGLGAELLEGITVRGAPGYESWLLSERRRLAAASEAILHEAAVCSMSEGALDEARGYAARAAAMSPLDENHQALLIRLYRLAGADDAARRQFAAVTELFGRELGVPPGIAIAEAMREVRREPELDPDEASVEAVIEAGSAAVAAGAVEAGVRSLRTSVRLADRTKADRLRLDSRLKLAEALIHSLRGLDEEGLATLHEADRIAVAAGDRAAVAQARAEIGYVDYLRARYDRAELWLTEALDFGRDAPPIIAKATIYLGCLESDRADYPKASALLTRAVTLAGTVGDPRRAAYALAMLGRIDLLTGDLGAAEEHLDASIDLAERDHWLAFLPLAQALRGEVHLARGDSIAAGDILQQAFARACQLGDPCWEGLSARGLALVAEATGQTERAFALLSDARVRCNRLADPYVWLEVYILDAQCELGRRHGHPDTMLWIDSMRRIASRTGMRELTVRSMLHGAALGCRGDGPAAGLLATGIQNPALTALLAA